MDSPTTWPIFSPPPASASVDSGAQWSRPPLPLMRGVRPNSPVMTSSTSWSRPRWCDVLEEGGDRVIDLRAEVLHGVGDLAVHVPAAVVQRHEADARLAQPPRQQHLLRRGRLP